MIIHKLKTWPEPFRAIWEGDKRFEYRRHDRNFRVGDTLILQEWNLADGKDAYTGREVHARITYLYVGSVEPLPHGMCIMSIDVVELIA